MSSVSNALVETTGRQTYRATLLPRPELLNLQDGTCNELTPSSRDFVIGVYGAVTSATAQGISIELGVSVQPRTLSVGVSRNVAILGGSYSAFLLPVENGKAFSTSATVTQYTGDTNDRRKALRTTVRTASSPITLATTTNLFSARLSTTLSQSCPSLLPSPLLNTICLALFPDQALPTPAPHAVQTKVSPRYFRTLPTTLSPLLQPYSDHHLLTTTLSSPRHLHLVLLLTLSPPLFSDHLLSIALPQLRVSQPRSLTHAHPPQNTLLITPPSPSHLTPPPHTRLSACPHLARRIKRDLDGLVTVTPGICFPDWRRLWLVGPTTHSQRHRLRPLRSRAAASSHRRR